MLSHHLLPLLLLLPLSNPFSPLVFLSSPRPLSPLFSVPPPAETATDEIRLEDRNVPEGHKGLHDDLYGDGESHTTPDLIQPPAPVLSETQLLPYQLCLASLEASSDTKVAAVYAVYSSKPSSLSDFASCVQVSLTRNLAVSLRTHLASPTVTQSCKFVRAVSFKYPQRAAMEEVMGRWSAQCENLADWVTDLPAADRAEHYAKKTKMRRAMADMTLYDDMDDDDDEDEFEDDWSNDIDAQTAATIKAPVGESAQAVSSPFESIKPVSAPMQVDVKVTNTGNLEFTKENVDKVLEEIRPYLISDGGNVKVEHINTDTRSVYLVLEGACGSCPSSTTTMKLGIERVLKENFSGIGEVVAVDDPAAGVKKELTMEAVEQSLAGLRPAITAMGGVVDLVNVSSLGVVEIRFRGTNKVQYGLELAVRDIPMVKHVKFVE